MDKKPWHFPSFLWSVLKYFGVAVAIIFLLISIASWIIIEKKNDWLLNEIQLYMNESQSGHLQIASTNFKIFRNFPDITIELDSILYYEHHDSLRTPEEKPILNAAKFFVAIKLLPLINDELEISEINISNAQLGIVQYQNGKLNIDLALAKPSKPKPSVVIKKGPKPPATPKPLQKSQPKQTASAKKGIQIDLQSISFNDVELTWKHY